MSTPADVETLRRRKACLEMEPAEFRMLGHRLVDQVAELLETLPRKPVTPGESPARVREVLDASLTLPEAGTAPGPLLDFAARALAEHSLFNGHPRFWGYITSSAAPIGILGEFLAAAMNPNVGAWKLSPLASEMEAQTIRWIAEFIGYPADCGGLLVSGGNMANFVGFLAARTARTGWDARRSGMNGPGSRALCAYVSAETHTWVQKAADLFGLGTDSIRWISTDGQKRMDLEALRSRIEEDRRQGGQPFLVVGTAGTVSTGAVDPLPALAAICREQGLWFHVDGAYGAVAAAVPGAPPDLRGLAEADSVAIDPHKWLYAPLEAGCALVRSTESLLATFSYHPAYYHFESDVVNYFDLGMQNSRGFRALKVWLALRQAGREGYVHAISEDIRLAQHAYRLVEGHAELQAVTQGLSITTFRYVPPDLRARLGEARVEEYLDRLNQELLARIEVGGEAFVSNALVEGRFVLRLCIVNFRTSLEDIEALPGLVARLGRELDATLRQSEFQD